MCTEGSPTKLSPNECSVASGCLHSSVGLPCLKTCRGLQLHVRWIYPTSSCISCLFHWVLQLMQLLVVWALVDAHCWKSIFPNVVVRLGY